MRKTSLWKRCGLHHVPPGLVISSPAALAGFLLADGLGLFVGGAVACAWFYLGRENAQAEGRAHKNGAAGRLSGWRPKFWTEPLDLVTPMLIGSLLWWGVFQLIELKVL